MKLVRALPFISMAVAQVSAQFNSSGSSSSSVSSISSSSFTPSSSTSSMGLNGWFSCSETTFSDEDGSANQNAECAVYTAPLCYSGVCENPESVTTTSVDIFVKRIPALSDSDTATNVWIMQGGPGASSTGMETTMVELHMRLNGTVNVYTMDHRGVGRSTRLDCVAAQVTTTGSPFGTEIDTTEVPACAQDLETKYGDLASFSITSAATDMATFISNYSNGANTIVYAVSYGTALVERLMHLDVPEITGYVLDGVATSSGTSKEFEYFSTWDADYGDVGDEFMALCATQSSCNDKFASTDLQTTLKSLLESFDNSPESTCAALVSNFNSAQPPSYTVRQTLGSLLQDGSTRNLIPPVVYRLNRCSSDDIDVLTYFFTTMNSDDSPSQDDAFESTLLYNVIVFSEMWETPQVSVSEMLERFTNSTISTGTYPRVLTYCSFSKENSTTCNELDAGSYDANGIIYARDQYWNVNATIPTQASVLLLSSKLDPQTPHKYAEFLLEALDGDKKELITFDYATHGTLWTTPTVAGDDSSVTCGMKLLVSYVSNNGDLNNLDKSCASSMPAPDLMVSVDNLHSYLSTDEAYDGTYDASLSSTGVTSGSSTSGNSSHYKTDFIVFLVLFIVALVVVIFLLYTNKHKKTDEGATIEEHHVEISTPVAVETVSSETTSFSTKEVMKFLYVFPFISMIIAQTPAQFNPSDSSSSSVSSISSSSFTSSSSTSSMGLNGWFSCSETTFSDEDGSANQNAECAVYTAPLCYSGVCENPESVTTTSVDIFVKRIPALSDSDTATNVWIMQGGPGASSTGMETTMVELHMRLNGTVNVYTMDHRGVGRSTRLDCVAAQVTTTGSPFGTEIDTTEVPACAQDLETKYGDLASFSITSAATDMATFISNYSNGANTIVYAVSYGTALVERLMHLDVPEITGYVLDGVATSSGTSKEFEYFSTWDADYGDVGDEFMALCATQSSCNDKFASTDLQTTLKSLLESFDNSPESTCAALVSNFNSAQPPSYTVRQTLGSLLQDGSTRNLIPPVVYRLNRCSSDDIDVLTYFFTTMNSDDSPSQDDAFESTLLYNVIVFSEMWETPQVSVSEMLERFTNSTISTGTYPRVLTYCSFSKENSTTCNELDAGSYDANGIIYARDQYWNVNATIPTQASVLLLSSKLDPQTPHKYAEFLLEALDGDKKELITFDYATHGTLWTTPTVAGDDSSVTCGMKLLVSYVSNNGDLNNLDKSCASSMPAPDLMVSVDNLHSYLSTDEAYDGTYDASLSSTGVTSGSSTSGNSSHYKTDFIVFLVLFIVALVVVIFLLYTNKHKKTDEGATIEEHHVEISTPVAVETVSSETTSFSTKEVMKFLYVFPFISMIIAQTPAQFNPSDSSSSSVSSISSSSFTSSSSTSSMGLNGWFSCSETTFSDEDGSANQNAECAVYTAPLCYSGVCENPESVTTTSVDIFVKRIPALSDSDTATNVWIMQGGPGASSTGMETTMVELHMRLNGTVNVYTMDHRGVGRSTRLDCVAAQVTTTGSPFGTEIDTTEVPACAQDLETKYGDLASFSITSAATDMATFISNYSNGANTIVYAVSYGTALVERLMHLDVPEITGYVLDGVATSSGTSKEFEYFSTWDADYGDVGDEFMALCATQSSCNDKFASTDLQTTLKSLLESFDNSPESTCAALVSNFNSAQPPSYTVRQTLGSLLQDGSTRNLIPPVVYRLNRCSSDDIDVLTYFFTTMNSDDSPSQDDAFESTLLYNVIVFSEMWETPQVSVSEMLERFTNSTISTGTYPRVLTYCSFSKENSTTCNELDAGSYDANGIIYARDQYWNVNATIPTQASVLLLSSKLDPQTPHKYAEFLLEALDGDKKELITFDYATHGTLWTTPTVAGDDSSVTCGMKLLVSYVSNNGDLNNLDKSCASSMPAPDLMVSVDNLHSYLSTDEAYDGTYDASLSSTGVTSGSSTSGNSSHYKTDFIVFLVLFIVALVVVIFLLYTNKHKKTDEGATIEEHHVEISTPVAVETVSSETTSFSTKEVMKFLYVFPFISMIIAQTPAQFNPSDSSSSSVSSISSSSFTSSSSTSSMGLNGWFSCSETTFSDEDGSANQNAECAVYTAPLCYSGVCENPESVTTTSVDIFVKRIPALSDSDTATNVWIMQGGPGASSTGMETTMVELHMRLNGTVNVYTMDHRGVGRSTRLDCVAAQVTTTGSPFGTEIDTTEVPACAQDLETKYGDLASFSITSAATDMATFISNYSNGANTIVYAVSYGTALVERLMHLDVPEITGYVLDGVATSSGTSKEFEYFSTWDADYGDVGDEFMALCATQSSCNDKFASTDLQTTLKSLLESFDNSPESTCAALVSNFNSAQPPSYTVRQTLGSLLQDGSTRNLIPPVVYRLNRCSSDDIDVLTYFFTTMNSDDSPSQDDAFESTLLYNVIVFSEMWETPQVSVSEMLERFTNSTISTGTYPRVLTYCSFSKENSTTCNELDAGSYDANGIIYARDQYWNVNATIPTQASVLLLSSKLDPQTPHKYAEFLLEALDGDKKELITFDYATHGTLWTTPTVAGDDSSVTCGMKLLVSYVSNNGDLNNLDKSCASSMPAPDLMVSVDNLHSYLSTDEAYDGTYDASLSSTGVTSGSSTSGNSSPYNTAFIIFLVLFIVALVVLFFLLYTSKQAKTVEGAIIEEHRVEISTPFKMKLYLAVVTFAQFLTALNSALSTDLNGWYPCSESTFADEGGSGDQDAECAVYSAPLCYPGICKTPQSIDSTVDIFVKRVPAIRKPNTATNVWLLQGGPGASSTASLTRCTTVVESAMVELHGRLDGAVNVYTMDHRGTGRSTLLDCVAAQVTTSGSPWGSYIEPSEVPACSKALEKKYGNLSSFSMTSAAMDIATFISSYSNSAKTIVYGVSYGTALVERVIHLDPPEVTGYVLDGVATSSGSSEEFEYFSTWDSDFSDVGDDFLGLCETQKECKDRFKTNNLAVTLQNLISEFDNNANSTCAALVNELFSDQSSEPASSILRRTLGSLLQSASTRTLIPPLVYRLSRCAAKDFDVLTHFFTSFYEYLASGSEDDAFSSTLLYYLIVFSEMWEIPQPSISEMVSRFTNARITNGASYADIPQYCAFSREVSPVCDQFDVGSYSGNGIIYERDQYWNKSATIPSQASVLLLSSKLDPQTPHKYAKYLLNSLNGNKKELITFNYATHATLWTTTMSGGSETCGMKLLVSYVANSGDLGGLDKSCVSEMPNFSLTPPRAYQYYFLSTSEIYDGVYDESLAASVTDSSSASLGGSGGIISRSRSKESSYMAAFITFLVLFVLALAAAVFFAYRWYKLKREKMNSRRTDDLPGDIEILTSGEVAASSPELSTSFSTQRAK
ncbi:hypothetical protein P3T76_014684 [Phytophthora citrophthora]|uniref:Serine protease family S33 n=1 Tax=Phytophthora citrophthora TaxID=4793 RepID=A0AAD9G0V9_9STRA|nr:hypothetical protein P3T76_014684 [Phytophthora citrophthora]